MDVNLFTFSSIDLVHQCLVDQERIEAYKKAIDRAVSPTSRVLDLGTGSGVLAVLAARAGAKEVYAVEIDSYLAHVTSEIIKVNELDGIIKVMNADARLLDPRQHGLEFVADVVMMDMLTTGLIDEYQVAVVNHLHAIGLAANNTVFIPVRQTTDVQIVETDFEIYGARFPMVRHLWKQFANVNPPTKALSKWKDLNSIDFRAVRDLHFSRSLQFEIFEDGNANAIQLRSQTWPHEDFYIRDTVALNAPTLIPIESLEVRHGDTVNVDISYVFGAGYSSLLTKVTRYNKS